MYCPSCGSEERQVSQFCRACGTDLRGVRVSLEKPDAITASAVSARDEIGRAIADRIRELEMGRDLKKVAEDVLPQIEKFLESPQTRVFIRSASLHTKCESSYEVHGVQALAWSLPSANQNTQAKA